MLWFFFVFFVFLCFYKIRVLLKSGTTHLDDPPPIQNTPMPSSSRSYRHDVFLSFRGEDTRKKFVDHLYKALKDRLIHTYKDDITLPRGESVGPALLEAIEESKFAVIVFSKNYADSSWCLDELVHIMKCRADPERGLIVIPIFYDVEPTEVRKQKGEFGKSFAKLTKMSVWRKLFAKQETLKVEMWRKALVDASNISGWEPRSVANGHESVVITKIVDAISDELISFNSDIDEELVGMRARLQDFISSLEIGSGGVRMVGIWGIGGGGKTTLATSVYMEISHHFGGHCIVENIREESSKHGRTILQAKILSTLLKTQVVVQNEEEGKRLMKNRLCHSNVLILLDDVDDCEQLQALAGSHTWFGDGSRIIITTRNKHLLIGHRVDHISPIKLLSESEAIRLFNKYAYDEKNHVNDYESLSFHVVSYAGGLPLALKILGSFLYDRDEKEWISTLDRLKDIPDTDIVKRLKISYDGLKPLEKDLFLDIACLFRGLRKNDAMEIFKACGFRPDIGIKVLIEKSLITTSNGVFDMHDQVQEMGHYIVRGEHPFHPEKHSRVWKDEEINNMCFGDTTKENNITEAIQYNVDCRSSSFCKVISNMKKLRWISVTKNNEDYVEGPYFLSNELHYFYWEKYPACPFPDSFQPTNLCVLKLYKSLQEELWKSYKHLPQLKVLRLHDMKKLVSTPDLAGLPCLQKLELLFCHELAQIHPSLGKNRSLEYVKVMCCKKLRIFPTIVQMEKLETLKISSCHECFEFPEIQANLNSLVKLNLRNIGVQALLSSIGERCTKLVSLKLFFCFIIKSMEVDFSGLKNLKDFTFNGVMTPKYIPNYVLKDSSLDPLQLTQLSISLWPGFHHITRSLRKLDLNGCCLKDWEIPSHIGELSNLQELDLSNNSFLKLRFSLLRLTQLKSLKVNGCSLKELPELPSSVTILNADCCWSLTSVGDFNRNCKWLCQVSITMNADIIDGDKLLESMLQGEAIENHSMLLQVEGLQIAYEFVPRLCAGNECRLQLPENWCKDFCGFLICAVFKDKFHFSPVITMKQVTGMDSQRDVVWRATDDRRTWLWYVSFGSLRHTKWWDEAYNEILFSMNIQFSSCRGLGVKLFPRSSRSGPTDTSTSSSKLSDEKDDFRPEVDIFSDSSSDLQITPRYVR